VSWDNGHWRRKRREVEQVLWCAIRGEVFNGADDAEVLRRAREILAGEYPMTRVTFSRIGAARLPYLVVGRRRHWRRYARRHNLNPNTGVRRG
jgi:hypothetical protein